MATTIAIDPAVRDRLRRYGHAGDTYVDILKRLMDEADLRALQDEARAIARGEKTVDWVELDDA